MALYNEYNIIEKYKDSTILYSEGTKIFIVWKLNEDKKTYEYRREYKTLRGCKNYVDKVFVYKLDGDK